MQPEGHVKDPFLSEMLVGYTRPGSYSSYEMNSDSHRHLNAEAGSVKFTSKPTWAWSVRIRWFVHTYVRFCERARELFRVVLYVCTHKKAFDSQNDRILEADLNKLIIYSGLDVCICKIVLSVCSNCFVSVRGQNAFFSRHTVSPQRLHTNHCKYLYS